MARTAGPRDVGLEHYVNMLISQGVLTRQFMVLVELEERQSNWGFVAELVDLYLSDSGTRIEQIAAILCQDVPDFSELERLGHKFAGSSATLGARVMSDLCVGLSTSAKAGDLYRCVGLVMKIRKELTALEPVLGLFLEFDANRRATHESVTPARRDGPVAPTI